MFLIPVNCPIWNPLIFFEILFQKTFRSEIEFHKTNDVLCMQILYYFSVTNCKRYQRSKEMCHVFLISLLCLLNNKIDL